MMIKNVSRALRASKVERLADTLSTESRQAYMMMKIELMTSKITDLPTCLVSVLRRREIETEQKREQHVYKKGVRNNMMVALLRK